ncbi:MAG: uracil-DNA glycosylase [Emcibacter sp.]|nr:uracil-DNA glycosylase [Emcibacter sp.]
MENKDIASLLQWYLDSGVDETTDDETLDWFALSPRPASKNASSSNSPTSNFPTANLAAAKAAAAISVEQIAKKAEQLASGCNNLSELNEVIKSFEDCRLKKTATHTVFADGNPDSNIMIIGEAPGVDEDRQGIPFVGENGMLLDKMFKAIGLNREQHIYITNILPWRPPGNRIPTDEETSICLPFIKRHIELFNPKLIILLGGISAKSLLKTDMGITRLRGKWKEYDLKESQVPVMPLFHPQYLLKQPKAKKDTWADLLDIKARIEELSL